MHLAQTYLDALAARRGQEEWDFFRMRLPLMVACGRREKAIEGARAHPEGDTWYGAESIAELLADAGRAEEAVTVLEQHAPDSSVLAWRLLDLGRVKDAVAVLQQAAQPGRFRRAGLISAGDELRHHQPRLRRTHKAVVTVDGWIELPDGRAFAQPSPALKAQTGSAINGWGQYTHVPSGHRLQELREKEAARHRP